MPKSYSTTNKPYDSDSSEDSITEDVPASSLLTANLHSILEVMERHIQSSPKILNRI